jgi:hypothetical protein
MAAARFVCEPLEALLHKPLYPLIDKATANPDRGGDIGDWYPISDE